MKKADVKKNENCNISTSDLNFRQRDLSGYYRYEGRVFEVYFPYDFDEKRYNADKYKFEHFNTVKYRIRNADDTETFAFEMDGCKHETLSKWIYEGSFVRTTEKEFNETKQRCYERYVEEWGKMKPNDLYYSFNGDKHMIYLVCETYKIENDEKDSFSDLDRCRVVYKEKRYEDLEYSQTYKNVSYRYFKRYKKGMGVEDNS